MTLIRQPLPPPIAAPVQTLQAGLDIHDHSQTQLPPALVAGPHPGAAQTLDGDLSKGPKHLHIVGTYDTVFVVALVGVVDLCLCQVEDQLIQNSHMQFKCVIETTFLLWRLISQCAWFSSSLQK